MNYFNDELVFIPENEVVVSIKKRTLIGILDYFYDKNFKVYQKDLGERPNLRFSNFSFSDKGKIEKIQMTNKAYIKNFHKNNLVFKNNKDYYSLQKKFYKVDMQDAIEGESYFIELEYKDNFVEVVLKKIERDELGEQIVVWELPDKTEFTELTEDSEIFVNKFSLVSVATQYLFFKGKKNFYIDGLWGNIDGLQFG